MTLGEETNDWGASGGIGAVHTHVFMHVDACTCTHAHV